MPVERRQRTIDLDFTLRRVFGKDGFRYDTGQEQLNILAYYS